MKDTLLFDRVKELTHITGTSDILLEGAANGFSAFSEYYSVNDSVFYAITDGLKYEIGSGQYLGTITPNTTTLTRNSLRSSNTDNSKINFQNGVKEVYSTYPGLFSVISNPEDLAQQTRESGVTFWTSSHSIDHSESFVWDNQNTRLGIGTSSPEVGLHVAGNNNQSLLMVSGIKVGESGVDFINPELGYFSGLQKEPFLKNSLSEHASGILQLSGDVDQIVSFKSQVAGTFLGVASGECPAGCVDSTPQFRTLEAADIPDLSGLYVTEDQHADANIGNIAFYKDEKHITYSDSLRFDTSVNPDELIVSGNLRFSEPSHFIFGSKAEFNLIETKFTEPNVDQLVSNSGIANDSSTDNVIINQSGMLVVPTFDLVSEVVNNIPPQNVGVIAFASGDSYIMIANGTSWVSGQLI